jgi:hypothetical protein
MRRVTTWDSRSLVLRIGVETAGPVSGVDNVGLCNGWPGRSR